MSNLSIIGELMNNSYGRARRAWTNRDLAGYQELARLQTEKGASALTLNTDGTDKLKVTMEEMLEFLPRLVPAIQEATDLPISFDNPHVDFHIEALKHFDRSKARARPILNSLAVSRRDIDPMIELVGQYDMNVIIMASECIRPDGSHGASESPEDILGVTKHFAGLLREKAGVEPDRIIVDPGLASIASDTRGHTRLCLDSLRAIHQDPDLSGIHSSVGLSNFAIGTAKHLRIPMERAFLRLAIDAGMDYVLANPEKNTTPMDPDEDLVVRLAEILETCRPAEGESEEDAGYRQLDELMDLWSEFSHE